MRVGRYEKGELYVMLTMVADNYRGMLLLGHSIDKLTDITWGKSSCGCGLEFSISGRSCLNKILVIHDHGISF